LFSLLETFNNCGNTQIKNKPRDEHKEGNKVDLREPSTTSLSDHLVLLENLEVLIFDTHTR